jgi:hypothetical protein
MDFDIGYDITLRHRRFIPSILRVYILRNFDTEAQSFEIEAVQYRRHVDIEGQNFDIDVPRSRRLIDIEKCTLDICVPTSKFSASLSIVVFFDIDISLSDPTWYWTQIAVYTIYCASSV